MENSTATIKPRDGRIIVFAALVIAALYFWFTYDSTETQKKAADEREATVAAQKQAESRKAQAVVAENAEKAAKRDAALKATLPKMRCKYDEFQKINWCRGVRLGYPAEYNGIRLYVGERETKKPTLRVAYEYHGEGWIFAESMQLLIDGVPQTKVPMQFQRQVTSGSVYEAADMQCDATCQIIMTRISMSKEVKVRYEGKQHLKDIVLTNAHKQDMIDSLQYFYIKTDRTA